MMYDESKAGQHYRLKDGVTYEKNNAGNYVGARPITNQFVHVQLTGMYVINKDHRLYQVLSGRFIDLREGWENIGHSAIKYYSPQDAQYYVNKVIQANKKILKNNLICAYFADRLTYEEKFQLYQLQVRLQTRNKSLMDDGLCTNIRTATPPEAKYLESSLDSFMMKMDSGAYGVGAVTLGTWAIIAIAATVVAALSTAAYFAYKAMAKEAELEVKYSDELTRTLVNKLTPEEFDQLMTETQGMVTKTKIVSSLGGGMSLIKWALLGVGGFAVYQLISKNEN